VVDVNVGVHAVSNAKVVVKLFCVPIEHHQNTDATFAGVEPDYVL
jgi:hypothetical protein